MDPRDYSHKLEHAGLRYEVGLSLGPSAEIVWFRGGVPCGSWPDIVLAREGPDPVISHLLPGELILADDGYRDSRYFLYAISNPHSQREHAYNARHKRTMARHEYVNNMFKRFLCTTNRFRHSRDMHKLCLHAIANIINCTLRQEPGSFPATVV